MSWKHATLLVALAPAVAWACCPAPPKGYEVAIADQDILVAWSAKTKTEHFVRRAKFANRAPKDFGFLVPTPSKPELEAAPDAVFDRLSDMIKPEHVSRLVPNFTPLVLMPFLAARKGSLHAKAAFDRGVLVLETKRVAGFDAAILEANDAAALSKWLAQNGYESSPSISDWAEPYVAAGWKITAFKFAGGGGANVSTDAIRMTFASEKPLFPYRVPKDQRTPRGLLRVFFVGDGRETAVLSGPASAEPSRWWGVCQYSKSDDRLSAALEGAIPKDRMPEGRWLTEFDDRSWPSSGDDLYFEPSNDQAPVIPPPIYDDTVVPLPLDAFALVLLVGGVVVRRRRKRA